MAEDRRAHERADVVGQLWGSVAFHRPVRDISRGGALLETPVEPAEWASRGGAILDRVQLAVGDAEGAAVVRPCRFQAEASGPSARALVALQFLVAPPEILRAIDAQVGGAAPGAFSGPDRRLSARVRVGTGVRCRLTWTWAVRLLDIGRGGALLLSSRAVRREERGEFRVAMVTGPFTTHIDVRWAAPAAQESEMGSFHLGVRFLDHGGESRRILEQFLRRAIGLSSGAI